MTTRGILGGMLLLAVLSMTGCAWIASFWATPMSAEEYVQSAIEGLNDARSLTDVKSDVRKAIEKLPTADDPSKVEEIKQTLTSVQNKLTPEEIKKDKQALIDQLQVAGQKLAALPKSEAVSEQPWPWRQWLIYAGEILGAVVVAFLLVSAGMYIWKRAWRNVEINVARIVIGQLGSERRAQPDFSDKLTSLSAAQKETNGNLIDLHTEVRTLARMVRESLADRNDRRPTPLPANYSSQPDGGAHKAEEPEFPVSVNEYLGKMSRYANAVKLDFQNGILVNDPENKDVLFLIQDSHEPNDRKSLFLVPGAAQFHSKQDFEIYYAKYYDCHKPQMGDVWIVGPAMVEKVPGGWQLREKGMLEVR